MAAQPTLWSGGVIPWSTYLPWVALSTPGCPTILQIDAINAAAQEWCEKTLCWQNNQDNYSLPLVTYGQAVGIFVNFSVQTYQLVHKIIGAHLLGNDSPPCYPRTTQWCDENYPGWADGAQIGKPTNVTQVSEGQFAPVPAACGGNALSPGGPLLPWTMVLHVAYKPSRSATVGPSELYQSYRDQIVMGACSRLMAVPLKAWSNAGYAVELGSLFQEEIDRATLRVAKGFGRGRLRTRGEFM